MAGYHISASSVLKSGDLHVCVVHKGLPVTLLECGTELLSGSDLVRVRELLALRPLVDLMQSLLPLYGRCQLLHQLPPNVVLVHVALSVHVGVNVDLGAADLHKEIEALNLKSAMF